MSGSSKGHEPIIITTGYGRAEGTTYNLHAENLAAYQRELAFANARLKALEDRGMVGWLDELAPESV